jgi:PAS domain S-box-containing protein
MTTGAKTKKELLRDLEELEQRLAEAEEVLRAIRHGEVDGILGDSSVGEQIYTLQGAERPYRVFFEAMNEGAITTTFEGTILYCNRRFADLVRIPLEKLTGMSFLELVAEDSRPALAALLAGMSQESRTIESSLKGTDLPVNISVSSFMTSGLEAVCAVVTDLSEHVLMNKLEAANKELEGFTYSVSHDLRAPIRHIAGFAKLLERKNGPELDAEARKYLAIITSAADQLGTLTDELLEFSRMGRKELGMAEVDLGPLIGEVVDHFQKITATGRIAWRVGELPVVTGDATMLRFVVENLLSNAVKYTGKREQATIEIGCHDDDRHHIIFIKDNGVGFNMAYYAKLFGVFQRLHGNDEFEGTGIGLANVQRIIHRHGGKTWAESTINTGATFYFSLPKNTQGCR